MTTPPPADGRFGSDLALTGFGLWPREWTDDDLPTMVELFDETQVGRWTPLRHPFDLAAARAYLDVARARRAEGRGIQLAITTDGRTALGEVLLSPTGPDGRHAELAYAIGAEHRRRGLATRAVRLLTAYADQHLGMAEVILRIHPDNAASAAVARATGFRLTDAEPITRGDSEPLLTWRRRPDGADAVDLVRAPEAVEPGSADPAPRTGSAQDVMSFVRKRRTASSPKNAAYSTPENAPAVMFDQSISVEMRSDHANP